MLHYHSVCGYHTKHILTLFQCIRVGIFIVREETDHKRLLLLIVHYDSGELELMTKEYTHRNQSVPLDVLRIKTYNLISMRYRLPS